MGKKVFGVKLTGAAKGTSLEPQLPLLFCLVTLVTSAVAGNFSTTSFPGIVTCYDDEMKIGFPEDLGNKSWQAYVVDSFGNEILNCTPVINLENFILKAAYKSCSKIVHGMYQVNLKFLPNKTVSNQVVTYQVSCPAPQADNPGEILAATNCTKDFMSVSFSQILPSFDDETMDREPQIAWTVIVGDSPRIQTLTLQEAMQQGYSFIIESSKIILQVSFNAAGVSHYEQENNHLYTVALKLTYGPPEQRLTLSSRMVCILGPVTCNSTHVTLVIPEFPGALTAINIENYNVPMNMSKTSGIAVELKNGSRLHFNKRILKSKVSENGAGVEFYLPSIKLTFLYYGEMVSVIIYPESCESPVSVVTDGTCTQDGFMDFEVYSHQTKPALNLDALQVRDTACQPDFKDPSQEMVRFHIPLNGCGTRAKFEGDQAVYENEIHALWADLSPDKITRDSEFSLTVRCYYSSADLIVRTNVSNPPSPIASVRPGPLSLILQIYPDKSYLQPYRDDQYPIVKYLRQPIYMEVQVVNRNDPNIKLVLDDCWATASVDPASLPRWNIIVDGCDYPLDNYRTKFHHVGSSVNYPNHYQRFEVTTFAFVSGGQALSSLIYFHCSVLLCDQFYPDSPLCSVTCPGSSRVKRDIEEKPTITSLPGPVFLVSDQAPSFRGPTDTEGPWYEGTSVGLQVGSILVAEILVVVVVVCLAKCRQDKSSNVLAASPAFMAPGVS
ncbi:zona pellucida sperm-binding protein 2 [Dromiciops gliroides]|uniref:zona pellucida sperm-binding protein 2 n=1 Tax=Dromiciops gliroides TaxID=33562 RepID=UPI001CC664D7|nr:zona pellucida sperm-binding protein 2 [Dromiciops gliroides]